MQLVNTIFLALPQSSQFVRYIQGCFSCCLNFNGGFLRYISLHTFVQTSLFGDGYGTASKKAFFLINRHREKLKDLDFLLSKERLLVGWLKVLIDLSFFFRFYDFLDQIVLLVIRCCYDLHHHWINFNFPFLTKRSYTSWNTNPSCWSRLYHLLLDIRCKTSIQIGFYPEIFNFELDLLRIISYGL